jgi:hypothetical protein
LPTPIQHLVIAEQILASPVVPQAMRARLDENEDVRSAFFFGHIAPDVQVISRQPRETTHFFTLPLTNRRPAYERMLAAHPSLAHPSALPAAQAAFLTGYIAHLLLDELWVREIFEPVFGPNQTWGEWRKRLLLHNVLRAWLDRRDQPRLRSDISDLLRQTQPTGWLPFASDADLCRWRDLVADQFKPGAAIRTVEIFANRARIPNAEFLALLEPDIMEERVLNRISLTELRQFYTRAVARTHDLIIRYLNGCAAGESV